MAAIPGTVRLNAFAVHVDTIQLPDTNWSRKPGYEEELAELKASIRATGLQVPPRLYAMKQSRPGSTGGTVARLDAQGRQVWEVRQGARRVLACQQLWAEGVRALGDEEWDGTIPALPSKLVHGTAEEVVANLAENTGRVNADPIARAESFAYLVHEHKLTVDQIAERTGYVRDLVADSIRLHTAPAPVQVALVAGDLPWSVVRTIVREADEKAQLAALDAALDARKSGANVAAMRAAANTVRGVSRKDKTGHAPAPNPGVEDEEREIRRAPGSKRLDLVIEKLEGRIEKLKTLQEKHAAKGKAHAAKVVAEYEVRVAELRIAIRYCRAAQVAETA